MERDSAARVVGSHCREDVLAPAPRTDGRRKKVYRVPPINTVEWEVKKALFDKKTRIIWPNAELSARFKNYKRIRRETILNVFRGG